MSHKPQSDRRQFLTAAGWFASSAAFAACGGQTARAATSPSAEDQELPFTLGLASYTTREFTLTETLAMAHRLELDQICLKSFHLPLDASPEAIREAATEVKNAGIQLYGGGVITMRDEAQAEAAFRYARAAGMQTIVGVPMPEILQRVDALVKEYDIAVAIHNHGPGDKVYPTPASAYEKIKNLDPRIGLCMDIGHTARIGEDPVRDAIRFKDRLLDVHLKDVSAAAAEGKTVEIGRGVLDIPAFLQTLLDIKFSRVASFEYEKDGKDPLPGLAESVGYVRGALAILTG